MLKIVSVTLNRLIYLLHLLGILSVLEISTKHFRENVFDERKQEF